ncbi:hypothetical protein HUS23_13030 [Ectothiorhodospiraceae bacterium 2226]|nr:hypothetical protein HUS23_13030 [Ectothiorhodospiraceae bacterium 2226]
MKTKLLTLLLAGAFTLGLAACDQTADQPAGGDQFDQAPADQPGGDPGAPPADGGAGGGGTLD